MAPTPAEVIYTPLYGCRDGSGAVCSLLEVVGVRILLDCGWDIHFDTALLEPLKAVVGRVDLVLISHPDLEHLGALPYAVGKMGLNAPVYCTLPVHKMGQMAVYDAVLSRQQEGEFDVFSLDDADRAFARVKTLKFSQHLRLAGRGDGIAVTPYAAGHSIGGAIWRILWKSEENNVIYAAGFNHQAERHLSGAALEAAAGRPSILIANVDGVQMQRRSGPKKRASELLDIVMATVRAGGNVLLPTDASMRVLELVHLLDAHWTLHRLGGYRLALLHPMAFNTCEFAKSQLEYMSPEIGKAFDMQRLNPFELKHVHLLGSLEELDALGDAPAVVMATDASLDCGFAKALFLRWAQDRNSTVLLTSRGHGDTTARELLAQMDLPAGSIQVEVDLPLRVPLQGAELREYEEAEARRRRQEAEAEEQRRQAEELEKGHLVADSDESDAEETTGGDETGPDGSGVRPRAARKRRRVINASLFHKYSAPQHLMFRYQEPHPEVDEYGLKEAESIGWLAETMQRREGAAAAASAGSAATAVAAAAARAAGAAADAVLGLADGVADVGRIAAAAAAEALAADGSLLMSDDDEEGSTDAQQGMGKGKGKGLLPAESAYYQDVGGVLPTRLVTKTQQVAVACRVAFVDMEGLSDARSVRNIFAKLAPKHLILVGGSPNAADLFAADLRSAAAAAGSAEISTPEAGKPVKLTLNADVRDVLLHDKLFGKLRWQRLHGHEVAFAVVHSGSGGGSGGGGSGAGGPKSGADERPPLLLADENQAHRAVYLSYGEVRIMDVLQRLQKAGVPAELQAGAVACGGGVEVRKGEDGRLLLQGPLGDVYLRVREVVYGMYTVL